MPVSILCRCLNPIDQLADSLPRGSNIQGIIDTKTSHYFTTFLRISSSCPEAQQILTGYVTSAGGTAAEFLIATTRAALSNHIGDSYDEFSRVIHTLKNLLGPETSDRVRVPAMEVLGFLYDHHYDIAHHRGDIPSAVDANDPFFHTFLHSLFADITAFRYRSTDARKLEAALSVYTVLLSAGDDATRKAVLKKLCNMLGSLPVARVCFLFPPLFHKHCERMKKSNADLGLIL